jgi:glycogen operon protein
MPRDFSIGPGRGYQPGVTLHGDGANFCAVSRHATRVFVSLFDGDAETVRFPLPSRRGDHHAGFITGVKEGQRYGLRAEGPWSPQQGHLFDPSKLLLDPYAFEVDGAFRWTPELGTFSVETASLVPKSVVRAPLPHAERLPWSRPQLIYEVQVRSFTKLHPAVPEKLRGTVAALAHPEIVAHIKSLGVDTVELMPLALWIEERHLAKLGLRNAWGYNPVSFFAPDPALAPGGFNEIRETVATLHAAGLRVFLDVVFNHTGEGDPGGPTLSLRGLDNALYYRYRDGVPVNDSGCGNTLALDRAPCVQLVMDAMRHWVLAIGIDGFRYDLAPVMGRTEHGFDVNAPLLTAIRQDPLLSDLIHIAEPWDVGPGGYQLGNFPAGWGEWNDKFRDDVRRFWRGDAKSAGPFATRLAGSSDVFNGRHRKPSSSINFAAAHDGFTLLDSVTYAAKNNHANGEGNRDGSDHEVSWPSKHADADVSAMLASVLLSRGTPMIAAGDEFGRTQLGNNNAYAQDNETTWLDWANADKTRIAEVAALAKFRRDYETFFHNNFLTGQPLEGTDIPDAEWIGAGGGHVHWADHGTSCLGLVLHCNETRRRLALWFNRHGKQKVALPELLDGCEWEAVLGSAAIKDGAASIAYGVSGFAEKRFAAKTSRASSDETVRKLANLSGIGPEWWEVDGTHHAVTTQTMRYLLAAMGLQVSSESDARGEITRLSKRARLPVTKVIAASSMSELPLGDAFYAEAFRIGDAHRIVKPAGRESIGLPPLDPGYYDIVSEEDEGTCCRLIVTPGACFMPEALKLGARRFGLSSHLYALRDARDSGVGDFETLARFCETTAKLGGALAGINPLHHMFPSDRKRVSPYQPSDRRFIDPIYIDVESFGGASAKHLRDLKHVDYAAVWRHKDAVLGKAFAAQGKSTDFDSFIASGGATLQSHAAFESRAKAGDARHAMWLQWIADKQLAAAAARAQSAGLSLGIYRDMALGCAFDGGEVAENPSLFASAVSLGAPPDPFSADGQIWNLPPFNPLALEAAKYQPFIDIIRANMRHAGVLRIDHILGFFRQFWIPRGGMGSDGAYVAAALDTFIAITAIESHRAKCAVIGEDLGTVPDGLREAMARANILSFRVLWFEQNANGFQPMSTYPQSAAVCLSSHDLPPFKAWEESASLDQLQKFGMATAHEHASGADRLERAHAMLAKTQSALMLVQADDLSGETEPLNVPGTDEERPNWRRRLSMTVEDLAKSETAKRVTGAVAKQRPSNG